MTHLCPTCDGHGWCLTPNARRAFCWCPEGQRLEGDRDALGRSLGLDVEMMRRSRLRVTPPLIIPSQK